MLNFKLRNKYWIIVYAIIALLFLFFHYLLDFSFFDNWNAFRPFAQKLSLSATLIAIVLLIGKAIENLIESKTENVGDKYNLLRVNKLMTLIFVLIVVVSFLFQNLYAVAASLGLLSLVLGFALQAPISSFIAWLYIIFKKPYQVGDRIQIDGYKGDVVEINYLDTTIEEFSGTYLSNDRLSGRVVHFPNSLILKAHVINYSGPFTPFIWNELVIQVAYTSDLKFVEACLSEAAEKDFKEKYPKRDLRENQSDVFYRSNTYAWMEAVVSYPVEPTDTTGRRNRILKYALPLLNAQPEKVQFPEGSRR